jgi:hypothetical protein
MDFHLADTMISLGRTAAEQALGEADPGDGTM